MRLVSHDSLGAKLSTGRYFAGLDLLAMSMVVVGSRCCATELLDLQLSGILERVRRAVILNCLRFCFWLKKNLGLEVQIFTLVEGVLLSNKVKHCPHWHRGVKRSLTTGPVRVGGFGHLVVFLAFFSFVVCQKQKVGTKKRARGSA